MKSQKNMDEKLECCLTFNQGLLALFIKGKSFDLIISFRTNHGIQRSKVRSVEKLMNKLKRIGVFRVDKLNYNSREIIENRKIIIKHSSILELLDEQGYEIRN